jgi:hypothetical protein
VGLRVGLDDLEKRKFLALPGLELRPLGRPKTIVIYKNLFNNFSSFNLYNFNNPINFIIRGNKILLTNVNIGQCREEQ